MVRNSDIAASPCLFGDAPQHGVVVRQNGADVLMIVTANAHLDPDSVPDAVWVVGAEGISEPITMPMHQHLKDQFVFNMRGVVACQTEGDNWIPSLHSAVWIPAGTPHQASAQGNIENYCLYVKPGLLKTLPQVSCMVSVGPLVRELLRRAVCVSSVIDGAEERLAGVLLDELASAAVEQLRLPMPHDIRLRQLAEMLIADPAYKATAMEWAQRVGLSQRTLSRMQLEETGMTLGRWRRQLHVLVGIRELGAGTTVQSVAFSLGYESASSYITMFRKTLGSPPARYLADRRIKVSGIS